MAATEGLPEKLDDVDMSILRELTDNSRQSYRELAEVVEVAPGSIGTLLARARRRFTEALASKTNGE